MNESNYIFWKRFYELCESKNKKTAQIVKELNLANSLITKWKNGTIPNGITLLALAEYFNVSIDYLLGRADHQEEIFFKGVEPNIKVLREREKKTPSGKKRGVKL